MAERISIPISDEVIRSLRVGDEVLLNGVVVTARDTAHKWLHDRLISEAVEIDPDDRFVIEKLSPLLEGGLIYHCGPVVNGLDSGDYLFVSAGPTTSAREEHYQADIIRRFNLKGMIGKGGMGERTLQALRDSPAAYFHAVGGAAALLAQRVVEVQDVFKLEFGVPEAMWVIRVEDFPAVVTMDANGGSLHREILEISQKELARLISR